jgi:hypothetical protein
MRILRRLIPAVCLTLCMLLPMGTYAARSTSAAVSSPYELSPSALANMTRTYTTVDPDTDVHLNGQAHAAQGIPGVDSVPTFNGHFHLAGYTSAGTVQTDWYTNTVGHMPGDGGTTTIGAPVIPVSVELLNSSGIQAFDPVSGQPLYYDATQNAGQALNSPVFQNTSYSSSSTPTQFTDAIQRAEYYKMAPADWHTMLAPRLSTPRVLKVPVGEYYYLLNTDGTCCSDVFLNYSWFHRAFFNTVVVPAIVDGSITQQDMSSFQFANVYLFVGNINACCILGYHSYAFESASAATNNLQIRWVYNYSAWYGADVLGFPDWDIVVLSHELAESVNDPFVGSDGVHDVVPWWQAGGDCSHLLEVADPLQQGQPYQLALNGKTWHPANVALLQWFEGPKSDALGAAYSYPDTTALTSPMVPQQPFCQ